MRGRFQALLVAVAGSGSLLFCWISAAVLALVTLRKGAGEGAWLLLWAMLPAGVLAISFGDSGPALLLLGATALAMVLRGTVSLALTVLSAVAVGVITAIGMLAFGEAMLEQMVADGGYVFPIEQCPIDGPDEFDRRVGTDAEQAGQVPGVVVGIHSL